MFLVPDVLKETIYFELGLHTFTYGAIDSFDNQETCTFNIEIKDNAKPVIENCKNQTLVLHKKCLIKSNKQSPDCKIQWTRPNIYDNSNNVSIDTQSSQTRLNGNIIYHVVYTATDSSNNTNVCAVNNTLLYEHCTLPTAPLNGNISCFANYTTSVCLVSCQTGYVIFDALQDKVQLICDHKQAKWTHDEDPQCVRVNTPTATKKEFEISLTGQENAAATELVCRSDVD